MPNLTDSSEWRVSRDGAFCHGVIVSTYLLEHCYLGRLSDKSMAELRPLLATLPKSKAKPPTELAVQVEFERDGKLRTEVYDSSPPKVLKRVLDIIGGRLEADDPNKVRDALRRFAQHATAAQPAGAGLAVPSAIATVGRAAESGWRGMNNPNPNRSSKEVTTAVGAEYGLNAGRHSRMKQQGFRAMPR